jgi:lipoyl(octanoyl) transferase
VPPLAVIRPGTVPYADAFALQRELLQARQRDHIEDALLLLEHPPTITHHNSGRGLENLRATAEELSDRGVVLEPTDRGGNVTLHAPGQLVGYPILRLVDRDLHGYLRKLEEVLIRTATDFGVETGRVPGRTGTWLPDGSKKLAAIGVKASRWVTLHGFALNVSTDLSLFDLIVPCGIADAGVTSLLDLGVEAGLEDVSQALAPRFAEVFDAVLSPPSEALCTLLPR